MDSLERHAQTSSGFTRRRRLRFTKDLNNQLISFFFKITPLPDPTISIRRAALSHSSKGPAYLAA
jgi:hypothetical protein